MPPKRIGLVLAILTLPTGARAQSVSSVVAVAKPAHHEGACPVSIAFTGTIFVNGPTRVSYRWERSDGATGPVETVMINGRGQGVSTHWELRRPAGQNFRGSQTPHVLSPGNARSNQAEFTVICR